MTIKELHNIAKIGASCHIFYSDEKPVSHRVRLFFESQFLYGHKNLLENLLNISIPPIFPNSPMNSKIFFF